MEPGWSTLPLLRATSYVELCLALLLMRHSKSGHRSLRHKAQRKICVWFCLMLPWKNGYDLQRVRLGEWRATQRLGRSFLMVFFSKCIFLVMTGRKKEWWSMDDLCWFPMFVLPNNMEIWIQYDLLISVDICCVYMQYHDIAGQCWYGSTKYPFLSYLFIDRYLAICLSTCLYQYKKILSLNILKAIQCSLAC